MVKTRYTIVPIWMPWYFPLALYTDIVECGIVSVAFYNGCTAIDNTGIQNAIYGVLLMQVDEL